MSEQQANYQANYAMSVIDSIDVQEITQAMNKITSFQKVIQSQLKQNHDFGVIPGTPKPTLLKPGAEKILMLLGLRSEFDIADSTRDFEKGFFQYQVRSKLYRGDMLITEGLGAANNRERKYLKMDPYTMDNTVLKMAKKRALVDAALLVGSLSDLFTQDLEDMDLAGEQVTTAKRYATDQDGTISKAQAKRMYAIAKGDADLIKGILKEYGFEKSEEVTKLKYDEICAKIEAGTTEPDKPAKANRTPSAAALENARKALYTKVEELGYTSEQVKDYMALMFNVGNSKQLTLEQIAQLIKYLEDDHKSGGQQEFDEEDVSFVQTE